MLIYLWFTKLDVKSIDFLCKDSNVLSNISDMIKKIRQKISGSNNTYIKDIYSTAVHHWSVLNGKLSTSNN